MSVSNTSGDSLFIATENDDLLTSILNPAKWYNVATYGAKPDGSDATAALQQAFDAAAAYTLTDPNNWANILIPPGIYSFTTLTIENIRCNVVAWGAVLKQRSGTGYNQAIWVKGDTDGGGADFINWYGLILDCNYPTATNSGSGIGFNIRANHQHFQAVECRNTEDATFVAAGLFIEFNGCISRNAGRSAYRLRGDFHRVIDCEAYDWNTNNVLGNRAILCDSQEMDVEEIFIQNFYGHISQPRYVTDSILIDCGDGHLDGTNTVQCGVATQVDGKAAWTIQAGHGFAPGDGFRVQDSDVAQYDGYLNTGTAQSGGSTTIQLATGASSSNNAYNGYRISIVSGTGAGQVRTISAYTGSTRTATVSSAWGTNPDATSVYYVHNTGKDHKIINVTGEVFIYVVDADTIRLYKNANDAVQQSGGSTGRYVLSSNGSGTMYIKSFGAKRKAFTVASQANGEITCTAHGFTTGRAARLSVAVAATDSLPGGLTALITTNTPYVSAGVSTMNYWRRKRIKECTLRNVRIHKNHPTTEDSACVKVNNTHNLLIDRLQSGQCPEDGTNSDLCLRIGAGNRKVTILNCTLPNGFVNNVTSMIPDLEIAHCEIELQELYPVDAIVELQACKFHLHDNTIRFSHAAINLPSVVSNLEDNNIDGWDIHDNIFEGKNATSATRVFDISFSEHLRRTRLVRFYNNTRRNAGSGEAKYVGSSFTAATNDTITSTAHCLATGDEVFVSSEGTLPAGLFANTPYYVRRTGDDTFTLHTNKPGADDNTNRVDITDTGSLVGGQLHRLYGTKKVGCTLTFSNPRDRGFMQRGNSGREFEGIAAPTNSSFEFTAGDVVWNMNPGVTPFTMGWICTKTGVGGTTAATFLAMPALS